jgi:NodT family efflux transporter outer membrane factor (OMF) lipoprotein
MRADALLRLAGALSLAGCDLAPKYQVPVTHVPVAYKEEAYWKPGAPADQAPRGDWWLMFGDPVLNDLEARVEGANPTLAEQAAAFEQARAFADEAEAGVYPTLSVGGHISTNRQSDRRPLRSRGQPNQYMDNGVDVQAHYEVDLWSRVANAVKAGRDAAQASAADLATVRLSLHAELASDYVTLRGLDAQAAVLADAEKSYRQALTVTQARFAGKIASGIDVSRAQAQLDAAAAARTDASARRALVEHAVAALVGQTPDQLSIAPAAWALQDADVPAGLPSTLLERRPDVAAAERLMAAANAEVGVARAAFYPTLSLNLLYGLQNTGFNIFSLPNDLWAIGPGVALPVFEGGLRDAEEAAALAAYRRTAAAYKGAVVAAFQEVEDALSQRRLLAEESRQEAEAVDAARRTVGMSDTLYQDGATNFLDVTVAQAAELQSEQALADLRTRRAQASIDLVRALGGGWTEADLPPLKG